MKMNSLLQGAIIGMDLREINSAMPAGKVEVVEGFLRSTPIPASNDCFISGRFDFVSKLDDGTYSVIDFKITDPGEDKLQKFSNQLHAYKFALENPTEGKVRKVSKMGVVAITPESVSFPGDNVIFKAKPQWFEIAEDMDRFYAFISEVSELLNGPAPAENSDRCKWCYYRMCTQQPKAVQDDIPF